MSKSTKNLTKKIETNKISEGKSKNKKVKIIIKPLIFFCCQRRLDFCPPCFRIQGVSLSEIDREQRTEDGNPCIILDLGNYNLLPWPIYLARGPAGQSGV